MTKKSFSMPVLTLLVCTAVLTSCGSDKKSNTAKVTQSGETSNPNLDQAPQNQQQNNQTTPQANNRGSNQNADGSTAADVNQPKSADESAAPVGRQTGSSSTSSQQSTESDKKDKKSVTTVTEVKDEKALTTGGVTNGLNYTAASDDGLMDYFKDIATTVSADQQTKNKKLAQAIVGAKFMKSGSSYQVDLAIDEMGTKKFYSLSGVEESNRVRLTFKNGTGDTEFQGGFLKCLTTDNSCSQAYIKIKMNGAYARVIFRNTYLNRHMSYSPQAQDASVKMWATYVENSITGKDASKALDYVKGHSYEVLNGKSAMGIKFVTKDKQVVNLSTLLVANESGSQVEQPIVLDRDLSKNYNIEVLNPSSTDLMTAAKGAKLLANNGRGDIKVQIDYAGGSVWAVLSRIKAATMTAQQVQQFESTVPKF